jgi:hypothetical protein
MEMFGKIDELQPLTLRIKKHKLSMPRELGLNLMSHFSVGDWVNVDIYPQTTNVKAVVKCLPPVVPPVVEE